MFHHRQFKFSGIAAIFCAVLFIFGVTGNYRAAAPGNLISNSDFEYVKSYVPNGPLPTMNSQSSSIQVLPIDDFLVLLPPALAQIWVDPASGNIIVIDAYGKRNSRYELNLGTTVNGRVTVKDNRDGTQRVNVNMHTKDALCVAYDSSLAVVFGHRLFEVILNLGPASTGNATFTMTYIQPAGPLSLPGAGSTLFITTTVNCDGVLRTASGFPEGTPGRARTTQVGRFNTGVPGGCPPETDANCFPAEKVSFWPTGN